MQDAGRSYKGTWDCVKTMTKQEGLTSFFRGSWLRIIRIAPGRKKQKISNFRTSFINQYITGGAIQFAVYEQLLSFLNAKK